MRLFIIWTFISFVITSCGQDKKNERKVTVILSDNQNPGFSVKIDTVMKAKQFDLTVIKPDIFFCNTHFHLPYYVPTGDIFKSDTKDKECDMKVYPATVKCYEYDNKNRVTRMTVEGSGTSNNFNYKYNDKNQIIEIINFRDDKYFLSYNADGTISELRNNNGFFEKRLVFIYN